jgi:predicted ArsR family transcriptional regulator
VAIDGLVEAVAKRYFEGLMALERGDGPVTKADAQQLTESLCRVGFDAEVESPGPFEAVVSLHGCPIAEIATRFPAFCAAEHAAMVAFGGGAGVKRVEYRPIGDPVCAYRFKTSGPACDGPSAPAAGAVCGARHRMGEDRRLAYSSAG